MSELLKDTELRFPHIMLASASAGSGKTYLLSLRFIQFLLSNKIKNNKIDNLFATTFTNNAAFEMKKRILLWLKKIALSKLNEDEEKSIKSVLSSYSNLEEKAKNAIEEILNNYHSFNVTTIDSFMTRIARGSAIDLNLSPEFDIFMEKGDLIDESVRIYIENLSPDGVEELLSLMRRINSDKIDFFLVDSLKKTAKDILEAIEQSDKELMQPDSIKEIEKEKNELLEDLKDLYSGKYDVEKLLEDAKSFNITGDFGAKGLRRNFKDENVLKILEKLGKLREKLKIQQNLTLLKFANEIKKIIDNRVHAYGKIHIGEITKLLHEKIKEGMVPELYFSLGDRFYHFLIDEFQDTNPVQWEVLKLLIDEGLSKGGSLFIVGDTKQSIYGFRGTDYRVMKGLQDEIKQGNMESFTQIENAYLVSLEKSYRSGENIIKYVDSVYKEELSPLATQYGDPTGLTSYVQNATKENKGKGYVRTIYIQDDDLRNEVINIVNDAKNRGYSYSDIAIITEKNETVLEISGYLTESEIPVISESGTDIRKRKVIKEIEYLLKFLDSPIDDFSFAMFIAGDIAKKNGIKDAIEFLKEVRKIKRPLYVLFKEKRPNEWERFFKSLFTETGYLSTYDLLLRIIDTFNIFKYFEEETSSLLKLLDIALSMEEEEGSIKHLIDSFEKEERTDIFNMDTSFLKNGVHLMTIHKAKGLEFDVVINVITKKIDYRKGKSRLIPHDTPYGTIFMKISQKEGKKSPSLLVSYYNFWKKEITEGLNKQYVAMTRPKYELYNLVKLNGKKNGELTPVLNIEEHERGEKTAKESKNEGDNGKLHIEDFEFKIEKSHENIWTKKRVDETQRGDFYHVILSEIRWQEDLSNLDNLIDKYKTLFGFYEDEIKEKIAYIVKGSGISPYFIKKPKREVMNEASFIDRNGHIYRMDRVIIDEEVAIVIDYKTGEIQEDKYKKQIEKYMNILKEIYKNKNVKGIIFDIDTGEVYGYTK